MRAKDSLLFFFFLSSIFAAEKRKIESCMYAGEGGLPEQGSCLISGDQFD